MMEKLKNIYRRWSLPEDRRGAPGATAGGHSMRAGGGEIREGQVDLAGIPEKFAVQPEHRQQVVSSRTSAVPAEDVSVGISQPTTSTGMPRQRINFQTHHDEYLMRCHFQHEMGATTTSLDGMAFRQNFVTNFPEMRTVTQDDLEQRRRLIIEGNLLPRRAISRIRSEVETAFNQQHQGTQTKKRIKWTPEMNGDVIRCHFRAKARGGPIGGEQHRLFVGLYPELAHKVTKQHLADQLRSIKRRHLISEVEICNIQKQVQEQLAAPVTHPENALEEEVRIAVTRDAMNEGEPDLGNVVERLSHGRRSLGLQPPEPAPAPAELVEEFDEESLRLMVCFTDAILEFGDQEPSMRNGLPKFRVNKDLLRLVGRLNTEILPLFLQHDMSLLQVQTLAYCAAVACARTMGIKLRGRATNNYAPRKMSDPPWKFRLQGEISKIRAKLGRLYQFRKGNRSQRLTRRVEEILRSHNNSSRTSANLDEEIDYLKQRLMVLSARLRRFTRAIARRNDNRTFLADEKRFYRGLVDGKNKNQNYCEPPRADEMTRYWSRIWGTHRSSQLDTTWLRLERDRVARLPGMNSLSISASDVTRILKRAKNWKAPGVDGVHSFWYKYLEVLHAALAETLQNILENPDHLPSFMTEGVTYMIPKKVGASSPSDYRPITCLSTLYKCLTAIVSDFVYKYCEENNVLSEEQKGCCRGSRGCKDQVTIDSVAVLHAKHHQRNLHMAYIDYQQAFPSVPHDYLLEILKTYKICPRIIRFLDYAMHSWCTRIKCFSRGVMRDTQSLPIKRGIFQGDSFSTLWFCLALNPLSRTLNNTSYGFKIEVGEDESQLTHLMYMDDIKVYASSESKLNCLLNILLQFSYDIRMSLGLDKCRKLHLSHGEISSSLIPDDRVLIETMTDEESYRYLGILQARGPLHSAIKEVLETAFSGRLSLILTSGLNARNVVKAINTYAIPLLTYSFGLVTWSMTDLERLNRIIRVKMSEHRMHHIRTAVERMVLPRKLGGRGILDVRRLCDSQVMQLREYFQNRTNILLYDYICRVDLYTPLKLAAVDFQNIGHLSAEQLAAQWRDKQLHKLHPQTLDLPCVDSEASNLWLRRGELFPETEGFVIAIQDRVIKTRNYQKHILNMMTVIDRCRLCGDPNESIEHIIDGCTMLASQEYTHRHNDVAGIVHQKIALNNGLLEKFEPYYKYTPVKVLENKDHLLYWDRTILTDHLVRHNRPDVLWLDKRAQHVRIIDISVPLNNNIRLRYTEKIQKYSELKQEILTVWRVKKVTIHPVVISSTGNVHARCVQILEELGARNSLHLMQKAILLNTCRIVRSFLGVNNDSG